MGFLPAIANASEREIVRAMFETILLLAPDTTGELVAKYLASCNPRIEIVLIASREVLVALPQATLAKSRLIAFTSPIVVPVDVLDAIGYGAYNFHPGPPSYPGLAPASFAIYQRATIYGATAHVMVEKVDSGPIVGVEFCLIADGATVFDIEMQSFALLAKIFQRLASHIATNPQPLPVLPVRWSTQKSSRRALRAICDIPPDIAADELERRIRAFANNHFQVQPTITLHGHKFRFVDESPLPDVGAAAISAPASTTCETDVLAGSPPIPALTMPSAEPVQMRSSL